MEQVDIVTDPNEEASAASSATEENQQQQETSGSTEETQLLAGKYKTEEELNKGILELLQRQNQGKTLEEVYKELESGLGKQQKQEETKLELQLKQSSKEEDNKGDSETEQQEQRAALAFDKYVEEFETSGKLSDDSYAELEKAGISRGVVDAYIQGQQALAAQREQEIFGLVGGQDTYAQMVQWAEANLSDAHKNAYNEAVSSGSMEQAALAVEALYSRFQKANGNPPKNLLSGDGTSSRSSDVYESQEQLLEDMNNPKYQEDPAFRKKVEEKLARSNIF